MIQIIDSFINCRLFVVKCGNKVSSTRKVMAFVPQGLCLSPTLFSIYTNDIPVLDMAKVALFAGDILWKKPQYKYDCNLPSKATRFRL